ncbi:MAG: hypothetical protein HY973_00300 [Candidatus Kerfeldbacteria bacterium]|nr:hypothetical protein [Candidatus Kerfeldbacteria bacterium]
MKVKIFLETVEKSTIGNILSDSDLVVAAISKTGNVIRPTCNIYGKNKNDLDCLAEELEDNDAGFVDVSNTKFFTLSVDTTIEVVDKTLIDLFSLNLKIE